MGSIPEYNAGGAPNRPQTPPVCEEAIPAALKDADRWLVWRWTWRPKKNGGAGGWDKPPLDARTGRNGKSTDPTTWVPFDEALDAYRSGRFGFDGLGFALGEDKDAGVVWSGLDLDDVRDPGTGELAPWAEWYLRQLDTYSEISPSATGVKAVCTGKLPAGSRNNGSGVEMYGAGRYFTVTGQRLDWLPADVMPREDKLAALHEHAFGKPPARGVTVCRAAVAALAHLHPGRANYHGWLAVGMALHGTDKSLLPEWDGWSKASSKYEPNACEKKWQTFKAGGLGLGSLLYWTKEDSGWSPPPDGPGKGGGGKSRVVLGTDEHRVNAEAEAALFSREANLYQRGGRLAQVLGSGPPGERERLRRHEEAPVVRNVPPATLRELLSRHVGFCRRQNKKDKPAHVPGPTVSAISARGHWKDLRRLTGVVNHPVLMPDGSVLATPGYHPDSGLLLHLPGGLSLGGMRERPTREDVKAAADTIDAVVCDFPFKSGPHKAAFVAALLTPLARPAFSGPSPLFVIDGNVAGVGKGLLADVIFLAVTGREAAVCGYTNDEEELRKLVTTVAMQGDEMVLLDNMSGNVGNATLDRMLTATNWEDRVLGGNTRYSGPLTVTWLATANNVIVVADTHRRICYVRLESPLERPELKADFAHPDLRGHVLANRGDLLSAALTVLRSFFLEGGPDQGLPPWGSYEGWSSTVRSAVKWAGWDDPGLTREELRTGACTELSALPTLLAGLAHLDKEGHGTTCKAVLDAVEVSQTVDPAVGALAEALAVVCEGRLGKNGLPSAQVLGKTLQHLRGRVIAGRMLERIQPKDHNLAVRWRVVGVQGSGVSAGECQTRTG